MVCHFKTDPTETVAICFGYPKTPCLRADGSCLPEQMNRPYTKGCSALAHFCNGWLLTAKTIDVTRVNPLHKIWCKIQKTDHMCMIHPHFQICFKFVFNSWPYKVYQQSTQFDCAMLQNTNSLIPTLVSKFYQNCNLILK
jgi:hypothetical protein